MLPEFYSTISEFYSRPELKKKIEEDNIMPLSIFRLCGVVGLRDDRQVVFICMSNVITEAVLIKVTVKQPASWSRLLNAHP